MAEPETPPRRSRRPTRPPDRFQVQPGPNHHVIQDQQRGQDGPPPVAEYDSDSDSEEENGEDGRVEERKVIEEEVIILDDRLDPEVPAPVDINIEEDTDGWCQIDRGGAWNSFLCEFQVIDEVPAQHRGTWVRAWGVVMQKIQAADSGRELDRALMWLCFLPQALLRQAKRRGKAGRKLVAQRFN